VAIQKGMTRQCAILICNAILTLQTIGQVNVGGNEDPFYEVVSINYLSVHYFRIDIIDPTRGARDLPERWRQEKEATSSWALRE
jgi:hypothetical protein